MAKPKVGSYRIVRYGDVFKVHRYCDPVLGIFPKWHGTGAFSEPLTFPTVGYAEMWIRDQIDGPTVVKVIEP